MKNIFICLLITVLISCKKDKLAIPEFSITSKANNTLIVFATSVLAYTDTISDAYRLRIFGNVGTSASTNTITLTIMYSHPISTGTFSASGVQSSMLGASIDYVANNSIQIFQSKLFPGSQNTDNSIITITSIDSLVVKGTFSGTVYYPWYSTPPISFTNGTFSVKFRK